MPKLDNRPQNNTELVRDMMEYSKFGAIAQLFIMDALMKQVEKVAAMPLAELEAQWGGNPLFTARDWHAVACDLKRQMDAFYNRHKWIAWEAGPCPVDREEIVTVRLRDGREATELAKKFRWENDGARNAHIVSYFVSR